MARKAAHQDKKNSPLYECEASQVRLRSNSTSQHLTIKFHQPHLKPVSQASRCADPSCQKRFVVRIDRPRNCSMCGRVFCHRCSNYRRKLSISVSPDPFGTLHNVCCRCFNHRAVFGGCRDHGDEFRHYRREKLAADEAKARGTLCGCKYTTSKRKAILKEVERLSEGFAASGGFLRGLVDEIIIPDWQKSANWVKSGNASQCYECTKVFTKLPPSRKIHCRIGGQVFCTECSKSEIIVFLENKDGEPKWSINGKDGGQAITSVRWELYPICSSCCADLEVILSESPSPSCRSSPFVEDAHKAHQRLVKLKEKVDKWLPEYQQVVDISARDSEEQQKLAKLHLDLSDVLLNIRDMSVAVDDLCPVPESRLSDVRENIKRATSLYYEKHRHQFCCIQRLSEHMPRDDELLEIQKVSSQQSMEGVYVETSQLVKDVLCQMNKYNFEGDFVKDIVEVVCSVKEDLVLIDERWEEHSTTGETSRLNLSQEVMRTTNPDHVRYVVMSQCSTVIRECYLRLEAKVRDQEFKTTKECLIKAWSKLESTLQQLNNTSHTV